MNRTGYKIGRPYGDPVALQAVEWKVTEKRISTVQQGNGSGSSWTPIQWINAGWRWTREEAIAAFLEAKIAERARTEAKLAEICEHIRIGEAMARGDG